MTSKMYHTKNVSLDDLVFNALCQLQHLNYYQRSIRRYQTVWKKLIAFAKTTKYRGKLREQLIVDFLKYHDINDALPTDHYKGWKRHAVYSLTILWHYARFGYFERGRTVDKNLDIPAVMHRSLNDYKKYCKEIRHLSPQTIPEYMLCIGKFLTFLSKRGITKFNDVRCVDLSDFVYTLSHYKQKTVASIVSSVRVYLKFLFKEGKLRTDISEGLPNVCFPDRKRIPSVWDIELITQLLNKIDRASPRGKRDYAILILACRLGLRSSDIRQLKLDAIDWDSETISIIQNKTRTPLTLPLTDEVGNALIDYIRSARPFTDYREIFLRLRPPIKPFSEDSHLHHIVRYWREIAGIHFRSKQRGGLHSLRHSLATHLLELDTPFSVISGILGHASMSSTMIYTKTSVEMLRQVALSSKEVDHVK